MPAHFATSSSLAPSYPRAVNSSSAAARIAARRAAILAAALEEFTARGFEGARLDDVAKRAGIAKGTIYLYFADKETLFQELVRSMVHPVLGMNVRGVVAMNRQPAYLTTRNPNIKSVRDFTDNDRIALPAVKVSVQAIMNGRSVPSRAGPYKRAVH